MNKFKNLLLIAVACAAGFLGGQASALVSAHGGDTAKIHGCVNPNSGEIKILDANATCPSTHWKPLDWNIQGEPGPAGPQGPQGDSGLTNIEKIVFDPVLLSGPLDFEPISLEGMSFTRTAGDSGVFVMFDGNIANNCATLVLMDIVRDGTVVATTSTSEKSAADDLGTFIVVDAATVPAGQHTWQLQARLQETDSGNCSWEIRAQAAVMEFVQ